MTARALTVLIACALAWPAAAHAQGRPAGLTLPAALDAAGRQAPDVMSSRARRAVSAAQVDVAGTWANPAITFGTNAYSARFYTELTVPLPVFGQTGAAADAAREELRATEREAELAALDVRLATTLVWIDLWLAEREAERARETDDRARTLLNAAQERFEAGAAPRLDPVRVRAEAMRAHADALATAELVRGAAARLTILLGARGNVRTSGAPPSVETVPPLRALIERSADHPAYRAALAHQTAASAVVSLEERRRWPIIDLSVGAEAFSPDTPERDAHVALTFEVPLFQANGAQVELAEAQLARARTDAELARMRIDAGIADARAQLVAASTRASAEVGDVLPAAEEAAELALEAYRAGRLNLDGVLSAQAALTDARLAADRAVADRARALATLEHATGGAL